MRGHVLTLALVACLAGCTPTAAAPSGPLPTTPTTTGSVVVVQDAALPPGHPAVPLGDPAANENHVGRAARRLNVDQLRASLQRATGFSWVARRRISDPDSPTGTRDATDADMLEVLAATLGRPDYVTSTHESIDPAVTFSKLAGDAARSACKASVTADAAEVMPDRRRIMRYADAATSDATAVRRNMSYLALRFWGRVVPPESTELTPLVHVYEKTVSVPAGRDANGTMRAASTPADAWRAVCIALATSPQFLTY